MCHCIESSLLLFESPNQRFSSFSLLQFFLHSFWSNDRFCQQLTCSERSIFLPKFDFRQMCLQTDPFQDTSQLLAKHATLFYELLIENDLSDLASVSFAECKELSLSFSMIFLLFFCITLLPITVVKLLLWLVLRHLTQCPSQCWLAPPYFLQHICNGFSWSALIYRPFSFILMYSESIITYRYGSLRATLSQWRSPFSSCDERPKWRYITTMVLPPVSHWLLTPLLLRLVLLF